MCSPGSAEPFTHHRVIELYVLTVKGILRLHWKLSGRLVAYQTVRVGRRYQQNIYVSNAPPPSFSTATSAAENMSRIVTANRQHERER